ncbi:hypothetical protein GCM10027160_45100 [Streptomyces calidiresistens]|uniref:DUF3558 domain-containing protein n=1 Tax=Streptomyces calidiresistens TaxID=1485586 RepID=A0A7W3T350_9ACTN|nr:hypothetical protein [Streptomyces calidiresistens]MBB0230080.1 hypothetical protein [Streptomyces calidiresistens]
MDPHVAPAGRAGRLLACALVPALLLTACSSSDGGAGEGASAPDTAPTAEATPEPARFTGLPNPCRTLEEETVEEVVPGASDTAGEELESPDTAANATCLWSGIDEYDFRSLSVSLRRFDSDPSLGSGEERAARYLADRAAEVENDEGLEDVSADEPGEGEGWGDEARSFSFAVDTTTGDDETRPSRQQRVVVRTANVVVTVDLTGIDFDNDDPPSAEDITEAAERVAREAVAAVEANAPTAEEDGAEAGAEDGDGDETTDAEDEEDAEDGEG